MALRDCVRDSYYAIKVFTGSTDGCRLSSLYTASNCTIQFSPVRYVKPIVTTE